MSVHPQRKYLYCHLPNLIKLQKNLIILKNRSFKKIHQANIELPIKENNLYCRYGVSGMCFRDNSYYVKAKDSDEVLFESNVENE